jgi:hypothetical protein
MLEVSVRNQEKSRVIGLGNENAQPSLLKSAWQTMFTTFRPVSLVKFDTRVLSQENRRSSQPKVGNGII